MSRDVTVTVENHFKPLVRNFVIKRRLRYAVICHFSTDLSLNQNVKTKSSNVEVELDTVESVFNVEMSLFRLGSFILVRYS